MERLRKQQLLEQSIYGAIWTVIFLLPLIGGYFAVSGGLEKEEIRVIVHDSWLSILPFFVLFLLNNYGLVPYFLFKKKYWFYISFLLFFRLNKYINTIMLKRYLIICILEISIL